MSEAPDRSIRMRNGVIIVAVAGVVAVLLWLWGPWQRGGDDTPPPEEVTATNSTDSSATTSAEESGSAEEPKLEAEPALEEPARVWTDVMGKAPKWLDDALSPSDCDQVRHELARVCAALDARAPELRGEGGACGLLEEVSDLMVADPPDLSSELSSYATMLENVFHVFRVTGRERMALLRRALAEHDMAEPAAFALYRWASSRKRCGATDTPAGWGNALYTYSGFLFNTLGGQAYLRRRSPRVEALACFYGLQLLEDSIRGGHNPNGLDPRGEIPRCRDLVASQPLVFSERYVAALDEMSRRWKAGAPRNP